MAEILQIARAMGLYVLTLAIAAPNLWVLARMLRVARTSYVRKLEVFSAGMLVCLPAYYLNTWLLAATQGWIGRVFHLPLEATMTRTWVSDLLVVTPVEEGLKGLALGVALGVLWRAGRAGERAAQAQRERVSGRLAASAGNGAGGANGSGGAAGATGSGGASDSGGTGRVDAWGWRNAAAPVYWGAMVAAGFACFENVLYALHTPAGSGQEYAVIAVRAVTSSLVHCAATSMVGLAVGVALRFEFPRAGLALAAAAGLLCAVLIHAGYNVLTQMPFTTGHARLMVEACAAVLGSSFPPLLAYAFGLIGSGTISSRR